MDREFFLGAGIPPPGPALQFEHTMPTWNSLSSAQEFGCEFLNANWDNNRKSAAVATTAASADQYTHYESALSSMVSSPAASNSAVSNDSAIRELIGKLGTICNSGEIPAPPFVGPFIGNNANANTNNNSTNTSCYSTPLNSPPKIHIPMPIMDQNMHNSLSPALPALSADPGFAERAAKFSCFGSRSFNGRSMGQLGLNNVELQNRSTAALIGSGKLPRVSSSPSLKQAGSPVENKNLGQAQMEMRPGNGLVSGSEKKLSKLSGLSPNSNEESSVSEQLPSGETGSKTPNESNSRKRKSNSRGKSKEDATKAAEGQDDGNAKRSKPEGNGNENGSVKTEEETKGGAANGAGDDKQAKNNQKPPEPPKDYIHVRARRGQATDSHSLAERVRREKISERMKLLQDLVPGCNKVTGKALMLDEIINYVQSLQRQVEFLSMKLSSVNPNMDNFLSKDVFQPSASVSHPMYQLDSSAAPTFFSHHQPQQSPQLHANISNRAAATQFPVDPLDTTLCRNLGAAQLPPVDGFGAGDLHQFLGGFCEDDLQSIVQMGLGQNDNRDSAFLSQNFPAPNQASNMKIEL